MRGISPPRSLYLSLLKQQFHTTVPEIFLLISQQLPVHEKICPVHNGWISSLSMPLLSWDNTHSSEQPFSPCFIGNPSNCRNDPRKQTVYIRSVNWLSYKSKDKRSYCFAKCKIYSPHIKMASLSLKFHLSLIWVRDKWDTRIGHSWQLDLTVWRQWYFWGTW